MGVTTQQWPVSVPSIKTSLELQTFSFSSVKMTTKSGLTLDDVLFPPIEALKTGMLKVSPIHTIYWEISGKPSGIPVMVLHGGPGGGSEAEYRRYFDPKVYQIIQMDQRGCGQSTPHAELEDNNTQGLVRDIEKLRQFLGVDTWCVFGGSWGSTLSLTYAIFHPERVRALMLRDIFMCRRSDSKYIDKADNLDFAAAFSRIECHYFVNAIFLEDGFILKQAGKLMNIPVHIVQGRYDVVCPAVSAWELHQALPHSTLSIVPGAGHSMGEVGIAKELVDITNQYK